MDQPNLGYSSLVLATRLKLEESKLVYWVSAENRSIDVLVLFLPIVFVLTQIHFSIKKRSFPFYGNDARDRA